MDHVPQVKGLRVTQILEEARRHVDIDSYMPDLNYDILPNRDFVINDGKTSRKLWLLHPGKHTLDLASLTLEWQPDLGMATRSWTKIPLIKIY